MTADRDLPDLRWQYLLAGDGAMTLVKDLLGQGSNVLLTPTWIAQALFMTIALG